MHHTFTFSTQKQEILSISRLMIAAEKEQEVTQCLVNGLSKLLCYDTMAVYVANEEDLTLQPIIVQGPQLTNPNLSSWTIPLGTGILGAVMKQGKAECINDSHLDQRAVYPSNVKVEQEQLMAFPLKQGTKNWGVLAINRISSVGFCEEEFEFAEFLASYASLALSNTTLIKKLKDKEHDQTLILQSIPDIIFCIRKGPIDKLEVIGRNGWGNPIEMTMEKAHVDLYTAKFAQAIASKESVQFEYETRMDETSCYYEVRIAYINDEECLAVVRNLTEARAVQRQLENAEALKRIIVDTISDAVITIDSKRKILFVNDVVEKIFGYKKEELLGADLDLIIPEYMKELHHHAMDNYLTTGKRKHASWIGLELYGLHKNQHEIPIEISFGETKVDGAPIFSAIIRDTSLRKKEETQIKSTSLRLSKLLQTMQAGVLVEDENRKIVLCNNQFCTMFGIEIPSEKMVGTDCSNAAEQSKFFFKDPEAFVSRIQFLLSQKATVTGDELELADGRIFDRDYIPIYSENLYRGHMWVYHDITLRKKNEEELLHAKLEAEHLMNAKQDFLSRMSHELRTPINGVLGLANLMLNSELTKANSEYLHGILSSGEHLLAVINDILDLAKIEAGKLDIVEKPFNLAGLIGALIENQKPIADQKGIHLSANIDHLIPKMIIGDPVRVNQVLLNLLSNAIKFTDAGSVLLSCQAERNEGGESVHEFIVRDTGIGIPKEKLGSIFETFIQADQKTSAKYGGTGLGLSIVKELTELQHGTVTVESEINEGSSFTVRIPFKVCDEKLSENVNTGCNSPFNQRKSFRNSRILVAEDNLINQLVVKNTLQQWAIHVTIANNGLEALKKLREEKFDLVIMDVQMPEMDGLEASQKIRSEFDEPTCSIPILAMTASVLHDPVGRVKSAGMNDYIPKPFKVDELYMKLSHYLEAKEEVIPSKTVVDCYSGKGYINLSYLEKIGSGNTDFIKEMLALFTKQSVEFIKRIKQQLVNKEYSAMERNAHSFKPQGAYLGVDALKDIVADLEKVAHEGKETDRMAGLISQSEAIIDAVLLEINNLHLIK